MFDSVTVKNSEMSTQQDNFLVGFGGLRPLGAFLVASSIFSPQVTQIWTLFEIWPPNFLRHKS